MRCHTCSHSFNIHHHHHSSRGHGLVENITPGVGSTSQRAAASTVSHNTRIRCICGHGYSTPQMIQCGTPGCGLWQHCGCVGLQGRRELPKHYICVACRMARADPFWEPVAGVDFAPMHLRSAAGYHQAVRYPYVRIVCNLVRHHLVDYRAFVDLTRALFSTMSRSPSCARLALICNCGPIVCVQMTKCSTAFCGPMARHCSSITWLVV